MYGRGSGWGQQHEVDGFNQFRPWRKEGVQRRENTRQRGGGGGGPNYANRQRQYERNRYYDYYANEQYNYDNNDYQGYASNNQEERWSGNADDRSLPKTLSGRLGYPQLQIKSAMGVLSYLSTDYTFATLMEKLSIPIGDMKSRVSFQPSPNWHGTLEDYKKNFLPFGGIVHDENRHSGAAVAKSIAVKSSKVRSTIVKSVESTNGQMDPEMDEGSLVVTNDTPSKNSGSETASFDSLSGLSSASTSATQNTLESKQPLKSMIFAVPRSVSLNRSAKDSDGDSVKSCTSGSSSDDNRKLAARPLASGTGVNDVTKGTINKCDYCNATGSDSEIQAHLTLKEHYSASNYETIVEGDSKSLSFVLEPMKWVKKLAHNKTIAVLCPYCPHEIFNNVSVCSAHCDVMHDQPNCYALSSVVWKGTCDISREFECKKCRLRFSKLQKLNQHWRQNVDHLPGSINKFMNPDHILFFYCWFCTTKHWDFHAMANHVINSHQDKYAKLTFLVVRSKKQKHSFPPLNHRDGNKFYVKQLENLASQTKQIHGAKSQAVKMVKKKIIYYQNIGIGKS